MKDAKQLWIDEIQSEIDSYKRRIARLKIQVRRREILIERLKDKRQWQP